MSRTRLIGVGLVFDNLASYRHIGVIRTIDRQTDTLTDRQTTGTYIYTCIHNYIHIYIHTYIQVYIDRQIIGERDRKTGGRKTDKNTDRGKKERHV